LVAALEALTEAVLLAALAVELVVLRQYCNLLTELKDKVFLVDFLETVLAILQSWAAVVAERDNPGTVPTKLTM
jgi:hypothetical protein